MTEQEAMAASIFPNWIAENKEASEIYNAVLPQLKKAGTCFPCDLDEPGSKYSEFAPLAVIIEGDLGQISVYKKDGILTVVWDMAHPSIPVEEREEDLMETLPTWRALVADLKANHPNIRTRSYMD